MLCIAMEVSNLIGPSGSLRPVLESIFHRILIHPKKHDRLGPITVVTDMLNSTDNLQCLSYIKYKNPDHEVDSMAVFKLLVKALEECCEGEDTPDQGLIAQSLDCLRSLLKTMTKFITKECIHESVAADILKLYPKLSDSDYKGPFTYDVETSLPQEYKDIIKKEKEYNESSESDSKKLEKEKSLEESQEENVVPEVENDGTDIDEGIAGSDLSDELSEDTEGPEEGFDNDEDIGSINHFLSQNENENPNSQEQIRRNKVMMLKKKISSSDEVDPMIPRHVEEEFCERENAKIFIKELKNVVNQKLNRGSTVEIDSHLQQFASDFCRRYSNYSPETNGSESLEPGIIMNADGIYLTSYMSLHLSLSMALNGEFKYSERENDKRQNNSKLKEEFINEILGSGLLVYLSSNWLSKVYDIITEYDIFGFCLQYKEKGSRHILYPILSDIDGFSSSKEGSQLLSEYCRLSKGDSKYDHQKVDACKRVCRRIITTTWSSILSLLNKSLDPYILPEYNSKTNPIFLRSKKSNRFRKNDGLINIGIECLEYAVSLCSILELHDRCGSVLSPLTNLVIGNWEPCAPKRCKLNGKSLRVIEKILVDGIELGSQSQDCWKHVIKCINYVISLDKAYDVEYKVKPLDAVGNALSYPMGRQDEQSYLKDVLMQDQKDADKILSKDLNTALSSACLRILTPKVDKLCDDVSQKLNLKALLGFLSELCFSSHKELLMVFPSKKRNVSKHKLKWQNVSKEGSSSNSSGDPPHSRIYDDLMIHKIGDLMLKFIKSGRPLIHIVRAWAIVGPHFMEAACHNDNLIAKKAVQHIHDITTAFLQNISELPFFHFNEAVFKPFENIVCLELCDLDIQDQVVSSICEFVESYTSDIRSGWRPLFGTLKAVQFSIVMESDISHIRSVLDVFNAFLSTDSPEIFAYAALDCVGCLIKHINGKEDTSYEIGINLDTYTNDVVVAADKDLSRSLFRYILRCHDMFFVMHDMPSRPVFHGAHKICLPNMPTLVDPIISHFEIHQFHESTNTVPEFDYSFDNLLSLEYEEDFQLTGDPQRLFKVWFLLLDGITNAVATIGKEHQSATVDSLFEILDTFVEKELEFGLYCTNHLLLPMLQNWLRRSQRTFQGWVNSGPNFKHCMGKTTELVLKWLKVKPNSLLVLKQLLLVLVECTLVPIEGIARLGCACFRHILLSRSTELTKEQWTTVVLSLCRAGQLTLYPLHQIMVAFHRGSSNFYGDVGSVQIAARRDSSRKENHRLQLLAQQVLLLDQQQGEVPKLPECPDAQERSFLFLLTPPSKKETQETMYRVTLRSLITGLAAHNIILQTIGTILLQGTNHNVPSLANIVLPKASPPSSPTSSTNSLNCILPGMLDYLEPIHIKILLSFLKIISESVMEFDSRPGLKFLVQKVAQLKNAANLYKHAGAAWSLSTVSSFEIVVNIIRRDKTTSDQVRSLLESHQKKSNTVSDTKKDDQEDINEYYFFLHLHDSFLEICETYVDIIVDKDGQRAKTDELVRQPLYFFSFETDDFYEITRSPEMDVSPEEDNEVFSIDKSQTGHSYQTKGSNISLTGKSEEVLRVATQTEINSVLSEFRHRKGKQSLPSTSSIDSNGFRTRNNPFLSSSDNNVIGNTDITNQQRESLMRDSEAQIKVWTELVVVLLDLSKNLPDEEYKSLLPLLFPGVKALAAHAQDAILKQEVADVFVRVGSIFGFNSD
uniref:Mon2/Sec7/BIG1-like HDS domain-containing protein n=1 Tax=Lepeophtheirus salmonis TaxID=72036 RepID=A0A0K2TKT2_LEPSM